MGEGSMNHIYKHVFNRALGVWQAVAEFARGHMRPGRQCPTTRVFSGFSLPRYLRPVAASASLLLIPVLASADNCVRDGDTIRCEGVPVSGIERVNPSASGA